MHTWILVPLDGSTFAERALPTAVVLARRAGAVLELVHAHDPLHASSEEAVTLDPAASEGVAASTHDRLAALARRLEPHVGRPVVVTILRGPPVTSLLHHIDERHADVVVMATHGATGLGRVLLGSVAASLVRHAPVPVLLVHPGGFGSASLGDPPPAPVRAAAEAPLFRRILVPLDGSPFAELALEHALLLGEATPAPAPTEFTLLRVVVPHPLFLRQYPPAPVPVDAEAAVREEAEARAYLDTLGATVRRRGFPVRADVLIEADIAAAIVAHADAHGHDLVAMATHGRGAARRLLLGSVADDVLRTVHTPLLLVHPSSRESGPPAPAGPERREHEATGGGRAPS